MARVEFRGSYRRAFAKALVELGSEREDLFVIDADTMRSTGSIEFSRRFPERFVNIGISEQDMVDTAAGMAIMGLTPVAVAFSSFMMRGWEQIRNTISRDALNVKLVATHSGLSPFIDGSSHQSLEDIALMRLLPNFIVVVPADEEATYSLLRRIIDARGPAYMRLGRDNAPSIYERGEEFRLGRCRVVRDGGDLVIFSVGAMVGVALGVADELARRGFDAGVVDLYSIKPADEDCIVRQASRASIVFTMEEHRVQGGLGGLVAEVLSERMPRRVYRVGVRDGFGSSARSYEELLRFMKLDPDSVLRSLLEVVRGGS